MEKKPTNGISSNKVKLLCSYGGKIQSRPTDHQLSYVGGDTKILAVDRHVRLSEITAKLSSLCSKKIDGPDCSVKYQLPGENLDALVSLIDDEDVEHMMVEYDRVQRMISAASKPRRIRLFVFDVSAATAARILAPPLNPGQNSNPDYLFGFDKEYQPSNGPPLDLLQVPVVVLPENSSGGEGRTVITETRRAYNANAAAAGGGGVYRTGNCVYGMVEQPMYNFVPVIPQYTEERMRDSTGNNLEVKVNQRNFLV